MCMFYFSLRYALTSARFFGQCQCVLLLLLRALLLLLLSLVYCDGDGRCKYTLKRSFAFAFAWVKCVDVLRPSQSARRCSLDKLLNVAILASHSTTAW